MNKIVESFLSTHISEYSLNTMNSETAFEHFINRCIINKYVSDRFDPNDIMTDAGEKGLDGVAIIINDRLIVDEDDLQSILEKAINYNKKIDSKEFLKVGDVVHCVVESMNSSFVYVKLKTEDSRNYGSIHISKITGKYIQNLSDEVSIADAFQAKIIGDFFDSDFGWKLSKVFES